MNRPRSVYFTAGLASLLSTACAPPPRARLPEPASRPSLLEAAARDVWSGQLAAAHATLLVLAERARGAPDRTLDYWSEVVALLRCQPLPRLPAAARGLGEPWDQLRRLAQLERMRVTLDEEGRPRAFSERPLPGSRGAKGLRWPIEAERWSDEQALASVVGDGCRVAVPEAPAGADTASNADEAGARTPRARAEARLLSELRAALPATHPALPQVALAEVELAGESGSAHAAWESSRAALAQAPAAFERLAPPELAQAWVLALAAATDGAATPGVEREATPAIRSEAIARLRAALEGPYPPPVRRALTWRLARWLLADGQDDAAVATLGPPPHGDDALGRHMAFLQTEAHARAHRVAEVFAEARAALGPHGHKVVEGDAALAAVADRAEQALLGSPPGPETLALLEAFGLPAERLSRIERFAERATAAGAFSSALVLFSWLAENDPDAGRRLQHLARACVAAARAGDRAAFGRTFAELAGQADDDDKPLPKTAGPRPEAPRPVTTDPVALLNKGFLASREGIRFEKRERRTLSLAWQRALLLVARDALAALIDNDDQASLTVLVNCLQGYLAAHGRGPVDADLTTIFRAASAHLKANPRGYAARVGQPRVPLVLGDIFVERTHVVPLPSAPIALSRPASVLFVPRRGTDPSDLVPWPWPLGVSLASRAGGGKSP